MCEKSNTDKQKGFTLVEVLASIVLISLIVIVSISFFIHSQQTQNTSAQITNATYVVQNEMENILSLSDSDFTTSMTQLRNDPEYQHKFDYVFEKVESPYQLRIRVIEDGEVDIYKIIVEAYENSKLKAKMETKIEWEAGA